MLIFHLTLILPKEAEHLLAVLLNLNRKYNWVTGKLCDKGCLRLGIGVCNQAWNLQA